MRRALVGSVVVVSLVSCSKNPPASPEPDSGDRSATHWESPAASSTATASATASVAVSPPPAPLPEPSTSVAAPSSSSPPPEPPLPDVKIANIGMHIGGGPNDDATKEPIKRSVEPYFPAFRRCWAQQDDTSKTLDFGVDLHIDKDGGKGKADHPRTASKSKAFQSCVMDVFLSVDFKKPKTGNTTVSYSLRFTPGK